MSKNNKTRQHYLLCLKEFKVGVIVTAIYISVSSAISYFLGYGRDPNTIKLIAGIPDWVFWGVIIPWVLIVLFTTIYGLFIMEGDEK